MQPYFMPYIGYFQLINAVDQFVIYDDVNYIKGGWINRNNILVNGKKNLFTIPLSNASSFKQINEIEINTGQYNKWRLKFLKTLTQSYSKAPYFNDVYPIIEISLKEEKMLHSLLVNSIQEICNFIGIDTFIHNSSVGFHNKNLNREDRLINICNRLKANTYINTIGGQELYDKDYFAKQNIALKFIKTDTVVYEQNSSEFVPSLSIIDVLMFNSRDQIQLMLNRYTLQ